MSEPSPKPNPLVPRAVGRLGLYATYVAAALFTLVVAGDLDVLVRHAPRVGWLALLVGMGPLLALLLSTLASYITYYGVWRVVRGRDEYDAGQDLKSHAADVPQAAAALLDGRAGCLPAAATGLLVLSLLLVLASGLPPDTPLIGALATWGGPEPTVTPTVIPTATPRPTPTATPTPTAMPVVIRFAIAPSAATWHCTQSVNAGAQTVTLDNSGSNVGVSWHANVIGTDGANHPWAVLSSANGVVPAFGTQTVTITPDAQPSPVELCRSSANGRAWQVTFVADGVGTYTFTYTVGP